ncbi:MAG: phosphotransferase [Candidatus Falkowbacteria bacterium]|nr:phosphotransferase [Candidatus Falkowbacteria bacterium]
MNFENQFAKPKIIHKESVEKLLTSSERTRLKNKEGTDLINIPELETKYEEVSEQILLNLGIWIDSIKKSLNEGKFNTEHQESLKEKITKANDIYERAKKSRFNGQLLGSPGSFGVVYGKNNNENCHKIIYHLRNYENEDVNSVTEETRIQTELQNLEVNGVRCPRVHNVIDMNDYHIIEMEQLDAVSLKDVKDGKVTLPENFKFYPFFKKLMAYVTEMHKQYGICHNDLHMGNIMINRQTGEPMVIDFGKSKPTSGGRHSEIDFQFIVTARDQFELFLESRNLL